jgi:hypothetical protein
MDEHWKPIPSLEHLYEASDQGRIRRKGRGYQGCHGGDCLHLNKHSGGYRQFGTSIRGRTGTMLVHRAVMEAFYGVPPSGHQVNHRNGDKTDNRLGNLEYATASANNRHRAQVLKKNVGTRHWNNRLTVEQVRAIRSLCSTGNYTHAAIGRMFGVSRRLVGMIKSGYCWKQMV